MRNNKKTWLSLTLVTVVALSLTSVNYLKRVADAYVYGYPLVIMELTRQAITGAGTHSNSQSNNFNHVQAFPDHTFKNVVRPNNDTLYSIAWLDLAEQPLVLTVPNTQGRHYVMPLMDAWTNVFAAVGKRSHGTEGGDYFIVGPNWSGDTPAGLERIDSPTNMVWLIGRIQTNGKSDIAAVTELQQDFTLTPFEPWQAGVVQRGAISRIDSDAAKSDPAQQLQDMSGVEFFTQLSTLMMAQPPADADRDAVANLASIGLKLGETFAADTYNPLASLLMDKAIAITHRKIRQKLGDPARLENGWAIQRDSMGVYGTNYPVRAVVAMIGLGALPPSEAAYPNTRLDSGGQPLSGEHDYRIHFAANELPPVDAFWSLSMYDAGGFFIKNPIDRYVIGDRDDLTFNDDGSLDLLIKHGLPLTPYANWLPAPKGEFALTLRLYNPQERFINGDWQLPLVTRVEEESEEFERAEVETARL